MKATLPLKNKVAFITGASRGIGQACAIQLARSGAHCIISARTQGGLIQTDNIIRQSNGTATLFPFDLNPKNPFDTSLDMIGPSIAQQFGQLDIFIHAAFHHVPLTPISHIKDQDWTKNLSINLTATMRLIRTLSPVLCATPMAQAVFLLNMLQANPFLGPVAIIQNAIKTMVTCWSEEIKQLADLTIHCLTPSPTDTALRRVFFPAEDKSVLKTAEQTANEIVATILNSITTR